MKKENLVTFAWKDYHNSRHDCVDCDEQDGDNDVDDADDKGGDGNDSDDDDHGDNDDDSKVNHLCWWLLHSVFMDCFVKKLNFSQWWIASLLLWQL